MITYRLSKRDFADLSGEGARLYGGRWNLEGHPALYLSEHPALATCENLVHFKKHQMPKNYVLLTIEIPDDEIDLQFEDFDYVAKDSAIEGNKWLMSRSSLVIKVPSVILPDSFNYIVNPRHLAFSKVRILKIENFSFDKRLLKNYV